MNIGQDPFSPAERAALEQLPVPLCVYLLQAEGLQPILVSNGVCTLLDRPREMLLGQIAGEEEWAIPSDGAESTAGAVCAGQDQRGSMRLCTAGGNWISVLFLGSWQVRSDGTRLLFRQLVPAAPLGETAPAAEDAALQEGAYRQELAYFASGSGSGLIAKCRADLHEDRVLESVTANPALFSAAAGGSFAAAVRTLLGAEGFASDRAAAADALDRENLIRRCLAGSAQFTVQYCLQQTQALPVWLSTAVRTFVSPETGHVEGFFYTTDVTDKSLERQVFSNLPMLGFDVVGLLYVQTHVCRYFRIKLMQPSSLYEHLENYDTSIGGDIERIVLPEQRDSVREGLRVETITAKLAADDIYPFTYSMKNREGKIRQKLLQFSYLDESRTTIFFCKSDITRQTESEHRQIEQLAAAKLEADRANEAKSSFLSSMSHDLRTPLNGIIGFTGLALSTQDAAKRQDYLEKIRVSGDLLLALVNDTLELSRIESGKLVLHPEAFSARELGIAVTTAVRPLAEKKGIAFTAALETFPAPAIRADRLKLQKIFLNLLSNAIKYTPPGGYVKAKGQVLCPPQHGCNYRFTVEDSGIGMSRAFLPHLFEPFSQEHRPEAADVAGTGLGLSIVKKTVDLMGGTICVESEENRGTRFTVELPLEVLASTQAAVPAETAPAADLNGRRVLLLEDNYLNAEIASLLLREQGVETDWAKDGREGLAKFAAALPGAYDAVLTDIRMPVMDGYAFVRALRAQKRPDAQLPVIAMTADAFEDDVKKCREAGMDDHVAKPIRPEELFRTLARVLGKAGTAEKPAGDGTDK